jgi:hypothetical protein
MSEGKHQPEPWEYDSMRCTVVDEKGEKVVLDGFSLACGAGWGDLPESNRRRIAACVNALEGINPEAVKDMVEALDAIIKALRIDPDAKPLFEHQAWWELLGKGAEILRKAREGTGE